MLMRYLSVSCSFFCSVASSVRSSLVIGLSGGRRREADVLLAGSVAITIIDVIVAVVSANFGARSAAKTQALEASGVLAVGRIMGMGETGTRINDVPLVKLRLRVEGPGYHPVRHRGFGAGPGDPDADPLRRKLVVLVDPATNQYQIDWTRSALISGMMPAQFTLAEDNRTYDLSGQVGPLMEIMHILKANGVPMDGTIDIRSNPVVRQQVMNVVRRAAASQQGQGHAVAPPLSQPAAPAGYPVAAPQPSSLTTTAGVGDLAGHGGGLGGGVHRQARTDPCRSVVGQRLANSSTTVGRRRPSARVFHWIQDRRIVS